MHVQVATLTKRPNGTIARRLVTVEAASLRFGRAASSEILLADIRVALTEMEVVRRESGAVHLQKFGPNPILVNGLEATSGELEIGDVVQIGPYEIIMVEAPEGFDTALTVELKDPLGDDFRRLQEQSRIGLERAGISKRTASWILFVVVALLFLALPVVAYFIEPRDPPPGPMPVAREATLGSMVTASIKRSWNSGELTDTHKYFMNDCATCHRQPFSLVKDEACLTCHKGIPHHFDEKIGLRDLDDMRCGSCHIEHNGPSGLIIRAETICTTCHLDIRRTAPQSQIANAGDFGAAHPPFRPTLLRNPADGAVMRVPVGADPAQKLSHEQAIKFPHEKHVKPMSWPRFMKKLVCADCHGLATGRADFSPITFDQHCKECHLEALKFDSARVDRQVPHGDARAAQLYLEDFYARLALEGGVDEPTAPASVRRRPGQPLTEPERLEALAWAAKKSTDALPFVFDAKRGCGACHNVSVDNAAYRIEKVRIQKSFLPNARFDHWKHKILNCVECHAVETSLDAKDVSLPAISQCRMCHAGEHVETMVPSTCISCHDFHRHNLGPMRPSTTARIGGQSG